MKIQKSFPELYLSLLIGLALFSAQALTAQTSANQGSLRVIDIEGDVSIVNNANNAEINAAEGASFTEGHTIRTGSDSSVILILSNGATLFVGPNSTINIETFSQTLSPESSAESGRPLNELEHEIGVSNISIQILEGTLYLDTQPMNEGSSIAVRDENVTTHPSTDGGAYSQHFQRERGRSVVEIVQGNVSTQGSNEMTATTRDNGVYHFENGNYADTPSQPFEESFITAAFIQRLNQARQSSASGEGGSPTPAPAPSDEDGNENGDINNIKDANKRIFVNPVTGEEVFNPGNPVTPPADDVISVIE